MSKLFTHSPTAGSHLALDFAPRLAAFTGLLIVLAGSAVQAQSFLLTAPPAGAAATTTDTYPTGDSGGFLHGPFMVAAGSDQVTYTATNPGVYSFESFTNFDGALDFPVNTVAIDTFDDNAHNPTGPLIVSFSAGVDAFGLSVESARDDTSTFSFTAYDGAVVPQNVIGQYTLAPVTQSEGNHHSLFLGAQAIDGKQITTVVISDFSDASGYTAGSNDFYFAPLSTYAPVPEAPTPVSLGLLALGLGGVLFHKKRRAGNASAS